MDWLTVPPRGGLVVEQAASAGTAVELTAAEADGLPLGVAELVTVAVAAGGVVVAGDPESSLLIKAVRHTDPRVQMPYKRKMLSSEEITTLETWVRIGAPMPEMPREYCVHAPCLLRFPPESTSMGLWPSRRVDPPSDQGQEQLMTLRA